jgi:hypothetical protein
LPSMGMENTKTEKNDMLHKNKNNCDIVGLDWVAKENYLM